MNDKLHQLILLLGATTFSLAAPACDLDDKNIGETGDGDTTGDGDGDGDGDTTGDGDGEDDAECAPRDLTVEFDYQLPGLDLNAPDGVSFDWMCTVTTTDPSDGLHLELDCPEAEDPLVIDVTANPGFSVPVVEGALIRVRYVHEGPWWMNNYLRLDSDSNGHLLTVIDGDSLLPPDGSPFELPRSMSADPGECGGAHECGTFKRLIVRFESGGESVGLLDGSYTSVAPLGDMVWLVEAIEITEGENIACFDIPFVWHRMLIVGSQG